MSVQNRDAILALLQHLGTNGKDITAYDIEQAKRALSGKATQLCPFEVARLDIGKFYALHFGPGGQIVVTTKDRSTYTLHDLVGLDLVWRKQIVKYWGDPIVRFQYQHQNPAALAVMWCETGKGDTFRWHINWGEAKAHLPWESFGRQDVSPRTDPPILFVNGDSLMVAANATSEGVHGVGVARIEPSKTEIQVSWESFYPPEGGANRAKLKFVCGFAPVIEHTIDGASPGSPRSFVEWVDWKSHVYPTGAIVFERGGEPAAFYSSESHVHLDGLRGYKKTKKMVGEHCYLQAENLISRDHEVNTVSVTDVHGRETSYSPALDPTCSPIVTKQGDAVVFEGELDGKRHVYFSRGSKIIIELKESGRFFYHHGLYGWMRDDGKMVLTSLLERLPVLMADKDAWMPTPHRQLELTYVAGQSGQMYAMACQDIGHGQVSIYRFPVR